MESQHILNVSSSVVLCPLWIMSKLKLFFGRRLPWADGGQTLGTHWLWQGGGLAGYITAARRGIIWIHYCCREGDCLDTFLLQEGGLPGYITAQGEGLVGYITALGRGLVGYTTAA